MWLLHVWSEIVTNIAGKLSSDREASLFEIRPDQAVKLRVTPFFSASSINPWSSGGMGNNCGIRRGCCLFWFAIICQFGDIFCLPLTDVWWAYESESTPPLALQHCTVNMTHYTDNNYSCLNVSQNWPGSSGESWQRLSIQIKDPGNNNRL